MLTLASVSLSKRQSLASLPSRWTLAGVLLSTNTKSAGAPPPGPGYAVAPLGNEVPMRCRASRALRTLADGAATERQFPQYFTAHK
eukprot:scaffold6156_cov384-Prasinococcus_capsulatus_cf.AAC.4